MALVHHTSRSFMREARLIIEVCSARRDGPYGAAQKGRAAIACFRRGIVVALAEDRLAGRGVPTAAAETRPRVSIAGAKTATP